MLEGGRKNIRDGRYKTDPRGDSEEKEIENNVIEGGK